MKCSFCKQDVEKSRGKILANRSGEILYFCSSKCEKNHKMGRNPRKLGWVRKQKKVHAAK